LTATIAFMGDFRLGSANHVTRLAEHSVRLQLGEHRAHVRGGRS